MKNEAQQSKKQEPRTKDASPSLPLGRGEERGREGDASGMAEQPTLARHEPVLPPCGHTDRMNELTILEVRLTKGRTGQLLVCSVPNCPEYCRAYIDLRDREWPAPASRRFEAA